MTKYITALRYGWLTPVYDSLLRRMLPEIALKQRLITQAQLASVQRVLDLGAGTGTLDEKQRALGEVRRFLRPDGEPHLLDLGPPQNALAWLISLIFRRLERMADNFAGRLPEMFRQAGFIAVEQTEQHMSSLGTLVLYRGRK